jgi:hypothetical protein
MEVLRWRAITSSGGQDGNGQGYLAIVIICKLTAFIVN